MTETPVEALGPPPFRFVPSQGPEMAGPAFSRTFKLIAGVIVWGAVGWCALLWAGDKMPGGTEFLAKYKAKFNADVQVYAPYVYDAVKVMAQAMVTAGSSDPAKYLPALKAINYKGVTGNIAFDEKGDIKNGALTLYTYKGGKREQIAVVR